MKMPRILAVMTMTFASAFLAAESAKLALVVGNAAYTDGIPELRNPANDASDISAVLEKEGWRVTRLLNASRRDLNKALSGFKDSMKGNPGSTSLFYYAGHGVQIDGKNYMLPIGEIFEGKDDIVLSAFCVDLVVDAFSEGKARDSLIILDACREDPFAKAKTRAIGTTRGLAVVPLPETEGGSATILATSPRTAPAGMACSPRPSSRTLTLGPLRRRLLAPRVRSPLPTDRPHPVAELPDPHY
ncbi:MAG: caspase family protein [Spirochaetota bacterium]